MEKIRRDPDWQYHVLENFLVQARNENKSYHDQLTPTGTYDELWHFLKDAWLAQRRRWVGFDLQRLAKITQGMFDDQKDALKKALASAEAKLKSGAS